MQTYPLICFFVTVILTAAWMLVNGRVTLIELIVGIDIIAITASMVGGRSARGEYSWEPLLWPVIPAALLANAIRLNIKK